MKIAVAQSFETLQLEEVDARILVIRLNRPAASNAITTKMGQELVAVFHAIEFEPDFLWLRHPHRRRRTRILRRCRFKRA